MIKMNPRFSGDTFYRSIIFLLFFSVYFMHCADPIPLPGKEPIGEPLPESPAEEPAGDLHPRVEGSGIFAIWYSSNSDIFTLPMLVGGQVVVQWKDVEKSKNNYDFSAISTEIDKLREMGKSASLQINGNYKPDYLFNEVPWVEVKLSHQVKDEKGSLMYWHPNYMKAYENLLKALGGYLSGRGSEFIGIRMNYNALGTEHTTLSNKAYEDASKWNYPEGIEQGVDWSTQVADDYRKDIRERYINEIAPHIKVFVRNGVDTKAEPEFDKYFSEGTLSLFHTSSETEPRASGVEKQYINFYNYCRSGETTGYAEARASSYGHAGDRTDDRVESMPQWLYWRLLADLHCGVSYIAVYGNDLEVAVSGKYTNKGITWHDDAIDGTDYRSEFNKALLFASKYAGYHASPNISSGAWVAFRGNDIARNENGLSESRRKLSFLTGDYDFLMKRLPDKSIPVDLIGSRNTRFGSWARKLPKDETMVLEPNTDLLSSLGSSSSIRLIWYDKAVNPGKIKINAGSNVFVTQPKGDDTWKESIFSISHVDFNKIEIQAVGDEVIMHMVEIVR